MNEEGLRMNPTVIYGVVAYIHFMLLYFYRKHKRGGGRQEEIYIPYYMYAAIAVILVQWMIKIVRMILLII